MSGAYQLAMSGATVTERRAGEPTGRAWARATITVRAGLATVKVGHQRFTFVAGPPTREDSGQWVVPISTLHDGQPNEVIPEGTTLTVAKGCGCGGRG